MHIMSRQDRSAAAHETIGLLRRVRTLAVQQTPVNNYLPIQGGVWLADDVTAPVERCRIVCIGIGDSYVGPAMADVAAVQGLRLIGLGHGHPAG